MDSGVCRLPERFTFINKKRGKMDPLKLPKQEDVTDIDLGNVHVSVVKLTDENRAGVLEVVMSMYLDDVCMYCLRNFTREELKTAKWAHPNEHGRIVHAECWSANN